MRTTKTMTISLPPGMVHQFEWLKKREQRTSSELMREAFRIYFQSQFPQVEPTKAELSAIKKGREAFKRGEFVSLDELLHDLDSRSHKASRKGFQKNSAKRLRSY